VFFVYQRPTKKVHEFKDFPSLIEHYQNSQIEDSTDLFWTLGLKSWIEISQVLNAGMIRKKKYQIPSLPSEAIIEEVEDNTLPGIPNPLNDELTGEIQLEQNDFVIISYEDQKSPAPEPQESGAEQRRAPRHDVRLKVIISNKEKTFLSYTVNVSLGGVMLEDKIPHDYFNSETEIFISSPKKNEFLAFRCTPVGDDKEPRRFSFGQISQDSLEKFQNWMSKLK
jgi:hypothetical protein